jgi:hypothetical protein
MHEAYLEFLGADGKQLRSDFFTRLFPSDSQGKKSSSRYGANAVSQVLYDTVGSVFKLNRMYLDALNAESLARAKLQAAEAARKFREAREKEKALERARKAAEQGQLKRRRRLEKMEALVGGGRSTASRTATLIITMFVLFALDAAVLYGFYFYRKSVQRANASHLNPGRHNEVTRYVLDATTRLYCVTANL